MFTIETYKAVLIRFIEFINNPTINRAEGLRIGQISETRDRFKVDSKSRIIRDTPKITFTSEEMRVVNVLADEGDIDILSIRDNPAGNKFTVLGRLIPNGGAVVEIELPNNKTLARMDIRLGELYSWNKEYSSIFRDISDGRVIETGCHQGFVSYGSGLITFKGKVVILPKREAYLLAHFIVNAKQIVYATEIIDGYYQGESNANPMTICSKIIYPLNNRLSEITNTKSAIKTIDAQDGYILDLT